MTAGALVAKSSRAHRTEGGVLFYLKTHEIPFRTAGTGFVFNCNANAAGRSG